MLPQLPPRQGGQHGATNLGIHVEGPFIRYIFQFSHLLRYLCCGSKEKKGAHPEQHILTPAQGWPTLHSVYGPGINNVSPQL